MKDSRHPTVLISDLFEQNQKEPEFIDIEVTYRMLFSSKYWRTLFVGISIAWFQQLTGISAISTYTYYIELPGMNVYGFRFIMYLLRFLFSLANLYLLQVYGRKSLILAGFLLACLCNCLLFQLTNDELDDEEKEYRTYVRVLAIITITIYYLSYITTIGTTTWVYLAETLPRKALGIALCCYYIVVTIIVYIPDFLIRVVHVLDDYGEFDQSVAILFLFFSCFCIWGNFIVLVFAQETKGFNCSFYCW